MGLVDGGGEVGGASQRWVRGRNDWRGSCCGARQQATVYSTLVLFLGHDTVSRSGQCEGCDATQCTNEFCSHRARHATTEQNVPACQQLQTLVHAEPTVEMYAGKACDRHQKLRPASPHLQLQPHSSCRHDPPLHPQATPSPPAVAAAAAGCLAEMQPPAQPAPGSSTGAGQSLTVDRHLRAPLTKFDCRPAGYC